MTMVLPSPAPATLALIFIGPWLAIPGMPVMTRLAAENCGTSVSENFSSMVAGAETCDLSAGVEDTSEGCANAAVANRPAAIGATSLAMKCERVIEVSTWKCEVWFKNEIDRKSTRLNSSHQIISYAVFCL